MRVLIAEDEALIRMDMREMLVEEGHEVVGEARDGAEAVELARSLRPDVIFMDVKMPGMDGIEAARVISKESIAPVVMVTAFSQARYVEEASEAGAMGYLVKPFTNVDFERAIRAASVKAEMLRQATPADVPRRALPEVHDHDTDVSFADWALLERIEASFREQAQPPLLRHDQHLAIADQLPRIVRRHHRGHVEAARDDCRM
jgi:DNA-binding NarL/FixJ family response regulator